MHLFRAVLDIIQKVKIIISKFFVQSINVERMSKKRGIHLSKTHLRSFYFYTIMEISGIVPFVATPLQGRYVVFLKWFLIGYFRLGQVIGLQGQVIGPAGLEPPRMGQKQENSCCEKTKNRRLRSVATKGTIPEICVPAKTAGNMERVMVKVRKMLTSCGKHFLNTIQQERYKTLFSSS